MLTRHVPSLLLSFTACVRFRWTKKAKERLFSILNASLKLFSALLMIYVCLMRVNYNILAVWRCEKTKIVRVRRIWCVEYYVGLAFGWEDSVKRTKLAFGGQAFSLSLKCHADVSNGKKINCNNMFGSCYADFNGTKILRKLLVFCGHIFYDWDNIFGIFWGDYFCSIIYYHYLQEWLLPFRRIATVQLKHTTDQ